MDALITAFSQVVNKLMLSLGYNEYGGCRNTALESLLTIRRPSYPQSIKEETGATS